MRFLLLNCSCRRFGRRQVHLYVRNKERILRKFEKNPGNSVKQLLHSMYHSTQYIKHCGRINYIRIIINECNSFFPEMQNGATAFVKAFLLLSFLFKICNIFCVLIIYKIQVFSRSIGEIFLFSIVFCRQISTFTSNDVFN